MWRSSVAAILCSSSFGQVLMVPRSILDLDGKQLRIDDFRVGAAALARVESVDRSDLVRRQCEIEDVEVFGDPLRERDEQVRRDHEAGEGEEDSPPVEAA